MREITKFIVYKEPISCDQTRLYYQQNKKNKQKNKIERTEHKKLKKRTKNKKESEKHFRCNVFCVFCRRF